MTVRGLFLSAVICLPVLLGGSAGPATAADDAKPQSCAQQLQSTEAAKRLADVKLADEIERSDGQVYLMRLELNVTKKKLTDALAKCGAACATAGH